MQPTPAGSEMKSQIIWIDHSNHLNWPWIIRFCIKVLGTQTFDKTISLNSVASLGFQTLFHIPELSNAHRSSCNWALALFPVGSQKITPTWYSVWPIGEISSQITSFRIFVDLFAHGHTIPKSRKPGQWFRAPGLPHSLCLNSLVKRLVGMFWGSSEPNSCLKLHPTRGQLYVISTSKIHERRSTNHNRRAIQIAFPTAMSEFEDNTNNWHHKGFLWIPVEFSGSPVALNQSSWPCRPCVKRKIWGAFGCPAKLHDFVLLLSKHFERIKKIVIFVKHNPKTSQSCNQLTTFPLSKSTNSNYRNVMWITGPPLALPRHGLLLNLRTPWVPRHHERLIFTRRSNETPTSIFLGIHRLEVWFSSLAQRNSWKNGVFWGSYAFWKKKQRHTFCSEKFHWTQSLPHTRYCVQGRVQANAAPWAHGLDWYWSNLGSQPKI